MKKKFPESIKYFCISVESSGERIASMKLGQRVKRVDYTGDMASKHAIVCITYYNILYMYYNILYSNTWNRCLSLPKVKVFVESTNEDIEYTSNHVIVAGDAFMFM